MSSAASRTTIRTIQMFGIVLTGYSGDNARWWARERRNGTEFRRFWKAGQPVVASDLTQTGWAGAADKKSLFRYSRTFNYPQVRKKLDEKPGSQFQDLTLPEKGALAFS